MGIGMGMTLRQMIKCPACSGYETDHEEDCPRAKLIAFCEAKATREHRCPKCHKGFVAINRGDYWECRKCHVQFSAGLVMVGQAAEGSEKAVIFTADWEPIYVYVFTLKGDGQFRDDQILAMLKGEVDKTVKARKRLRRGK